jgi:hypothetical protein
VFSVETIERASEALRKRERVAKKNLDRHIGRWCLNDGAEATPPGISEWGRRMSVDVVWTSLPPRFNGKENTIPSEDDAVAYVRALPYETKKHAELYIRRAPLQIDTPFRRRFENEFGWSPVER